MIANIDRIRSKLQALPDLPVPVRRWRIKEGIDATDEAAVWIWAYIEGDNIDVDATHSIDVMARDVVRDVTGGMWAYVLIRGADEPDPDPDP